MRDNWTDAENDTIVAAYFAMLADEEVGRPYSKAEHNRMVTEIIGRTRGSIEYKHQNISAVLKGLGETWIPGYKPAFNFQNSLVDAVARWLTTNPGWLSVEHRAALQETRSRLGKNPVLWIGPAPTLNNVPPPDELERMASIAKRFDVAERDEQNHALGRAGEECVLAHERAMLGQAGRKDLAQDVRWVSELDEDGAGYDIASFEIDGRRRLIEVKTTNGWERTPFYISRNELTVAESMRAEWCLVRLWNFAREPKAFEIRPPLDGHLALTPTSFEASFGPKVG